MILKYSDKTGHIEKMSKSKGNVVNPDEIVERYSTDVLRMYILFIGPPELDCEWQDAGLEGIKRFLNRLYLFLMRPDVFVSQGNKEREETTRRVHRFVKEFQERLAYFKPNTALSALMEFLNDALAESMQLSKESYEKIIVLLSTMAPCMASELLETVLGKQLSECTWPEYNDSLAIGNEVTLVIQVNGKLRGRMTVERNESQNNVEKKAREIAEKWLHGSIRKVIFVQDRMINFVVD
jgi:leucyl-tRNA synthetase